MTTTDDMVKAVKDHAQIHYGFGWDIIVEAWTDEEILAEIKTCKTTAGAIAKIGRIVNLQRERAREIRSTEW